MKREPHLQQFTMDLSASGETGWFKLGRYHNSFRPSWPATGAPTGTFTVQTRSVATDTPITAAGAKLVTTGSSPAGTAGAMRFDLDTCELEANVVYTRASGGAGCVATITHTAKD